MGSEKPPARRRIRDLGYSPGRFNPGPRNSILDVDGVRVGQVTIHKEPDIHTGLTLVFPRSVEDTPLRPCFAATHDLNGVGEMTGCHMLQEWGHLRGPIAITNTVSVGKVYDGLFLHAMEAAKQRGESIDQALRRFSIPIVAETFDGYLNDICASVIDRTAVEEAIAAAAPQGQAEVLEGNHGGGTGMITHGYKGGTGTSSRVVPGAERDYTLGVLVQANHGARPDLRIGNVPVGRLLMEEDRRAAAAAGEEVKQVPVGGKAMEGSIIVVIATNAPMLPHQLRRLAQHAGMGITQVGGHAAGRNFSGEIFLALSTGTDADQLAEASDGMGYLPKLEDYTVKGLRTETIDSLFYAVSEATEEAILNAMCQAETLTGQEGRTIHALPLERVKSLLDKYMVT
ncbi:Peptidase family S58 [Pleurostoma richardsiae]|uniref:Peptidase family S58 n=1 Tax=Pleurostoma richardsiae TaxID=41990 RepID=A0AA38S9A6_9PEZI|nr:Peptidase family S58 [Pleurostoma richardsiae]